MKVIKKYYFIEVIKSYTKDGEKSTIYSLQGKLEHNKGDFKASFCCLALEGKSKRGDKKNPSEIISKSFQ